MLEQNKRDNTNGFLEFYYFCIALQFNLFNNIGMEVLAHLYCLEMTQY